MVRTGRRPCRRGAGGCVDEAPTATTAPRLDLAGPDRMVDELPSRALGPAARAVLAGAAGLCTLLAINQLLNLQLFVGLVFIENRYLFLLAAVLFPVVFIALPARSALAGTPW